MKKKKTKSKINQKGGNNRLYEYLFQKLKPSKKTLKKVAKHATAKNGREVKKSIKYAKTARRVLNNSIENTRKDHRRRYKWAYDFVEKQPVAAQVIGGILSAGFDLGSNKKSW